jgi:hypothetical protein
MIIIHSNPLCTCYIHGNPHPTDLPPEPTTHALENKASRMLWMILNASSAPEATCIYQHASKPLANSMHALRHPIHTDR